MSGDNTYPMGWDDKDYPLNVVSKTSITFAVIRTSYQSDLIIETGPDNIKSAELPEPTVSRHNFIELCHRVTAEDEKVFKNLFMRLALSVDWRQEYATIAPVSRAIAQGSFWTFTIRAISTRSTHLLCGTSIFRQPWRKRRWRTGKPGCILRY